MARRTGHEFHFLNERSKHDSILYIPLLCGKIYQYTKVVFMMKRWCNYVETEKNPIALICSMLIDFIPLIRYNLHKTVALLAIL